MMTRPISFLPTRTLSVREVVHAVWRQRTKLMAMEAHDRGPGWLTSLKSFESRVHWHCHFIQKLERDPTIEFTNMHGAYAGAIIRCP